MNWNDISNKFKYDGSLRDIYVTQIESSTWNDFIKGIRNSEYKFVFTLDGKTLVIPENYKEIKVLQQYAATLLSIYLPSGTRINCLFFVEYEIELDITPLEITNESSFLELYNFLHWLAKLTKKRVIVTYEDEQDKPFLEVSP